MRNRAMLFTDRLTNKSFVLKYSTKAKEYVKVFEGSRTECVNFMMTK